MELSSALEWVGVALISKRTSHGVILGVAGSRYASGPYTSVDPLIVYSTNARRHRLVLTLFIQLKPLSESALVTGKVT